jgi:membrane associated rhomboid family serine protease
MRRISTAGGTVTKLLILANVLVFATEAVFGPGFSRFTNEIFGLSRDGLAQGWWWQLVTHQFLHGGALHLVVNMLMLWFAGRDLEEAMGPAAYIALYVGGGIAGGLFQLPFLAPGGVLIGASGSVCAVLLALIVLLPRVQITALLFFVFPVRMKAWVLGVVLFFGSWALWISNLMPSVGHAAHLGGFAFGFFFAIGFRLWHRMANQRGTPLHANTRWELDEPVYGDSATTREAVVEKVLRSGVSSLTRDEIRILESTRTTRSPRWK